MHSCSLLDQAGEVSESGRLLFSCLSGRVFRHDVGADGTGRPVDVVHVGRRGHDGGPVGKLLVDNAVRQVIRAGRLGGGLPAGFVVSFLLTGELPVVLLVKQRQIDRSEGRNEILLPVVLLDELVVALGKLTDFLLGSILGGRQKIRLVVRMLLEVLDLLLAVEHLPALDAKDLSVGLLLDGVEPVDEGGPFRGITLNHSGCRYSLTNNKYSVVVVLLANKFT